MYSADNRAPGVVSVSELTISYGEIVVRLLLSAAPCGVIGFERETRDQSLEEISALPGVERVSVTGLREIG